MVVHLVAPLKAKKFNLCPDVMLKNSDIYTKIWLSAPKITKTRKLKTYFPGIVSNGVHSGQKSKQKLTNCSQPEIFKVGVKGLRVG